MRTFPENRLWSYTWDVMDDLSVVPQESIIDYLLDRLQRGQIYTWVGTLLLAINPSGEITTDENIYDLLRADEYDNACSLTHKEVAPHVFAVAARAHCRIIQGLGKSSQVIVLNGETGAGKTFNAWKALEFLTASTRHAFADAQKQDTVCGIVQRIADACRLTSAFSTAPTERNEVSSRNVQLVWLEYKTGRMCGARISSYLLERDRVTKGCCNFQIFGQMMSALADAEFADTGLSKDMQYFMLSDLDPVKGQHFRDGFQDTLKAMDMLGFTEDQRRNIFLVLSLLIHMSNIQFVQEDDHCRIDTDSQESKEAFENTCRLACLEKEDVAGLLTSILISPQSSRRRHTACRRNLNTYDACRYRLHSIIRHLYDLLFHWLINHINGILSAPVFNEQLGILDIFGFECFDANGIEQLCVNYVNERLQQHFVEKYLESCRRDLQAEGLLDDQEPSGIVQLYEDRLSTIEKYLFTALNDVCLSTVPSDSSTLIRQVNAKSYPATRRFLHVNNDNFVVHHYAGAVEYSVDDLLSKNTDKIPDEITTTFSVCKSKFLYSLIDKYKPHHAGKVKKPTMLSKLRYDVDLLIQELNKCDMHYVRCIKPRRLGNHDWDRDELRRQLTNTGILDALPLARCKYPIHFTYEDFFARYCGRRKGTSHLRTACEKTLESYRLTATDGSSVHYGKRLIFLTEPTFLQLESARRQHHVECVRKIESFWIKHRNAKGNLANGTQATVNGNVQNGLIEKSRPEYEHAADNFASKAAQNQANVQNGFAEKSQSEYEHVADNFASKATQNQANVQNGLAEKSQSEYEHAADNLASKAAQNQTNVQNGFTERSQSEYEHAADNFASKTAQNQAARPSILLYQTARIIHWLEDVNKAAGIERSARSSTAEESPVNHDYNQFTDIRYNGDVRVQRARRRKRIPVDFNEEKDVYVIQHGGSTLFYKNGILSRRRPTRLPIKVHTRLTCLTNSHYLVHTELPQGLQDCL